MAGFGSGRQMRRAAIALLFFIASGSGARAQNMVWLEFRTDPSGATATLVDDLRLPRSIPLTPSGFRVSLEADKVHHIALTHPLYDTQILTLQYDKDVGAWRQLDDFGTYQPMPPAIPFSKSFRLNVEPPDVQVWQAAQGTKTIVVGGESVSVRPMQRAADGRITVIDVDTAHTLVVRRSLFDTRKIELTSKDLATKSQLIPAQTIYLHPTYGPFSYWQFNVGLAIVAAAGAMWGYYAQTCRRRPRVKLKK